MDITLPICTGSEIWIDSSDQNDLYSYVIGLKRQGKHKEAESILLQFWAPSPPVSFSGKSPVQERSKHRIARVLETTTSMLESIGLEETSIPEIAKRAGITRSSIYHFFPNKYALFAHMTRQHVSKIVNAMVIAGQRQMDEHPNQWDQYIHQMIIAAANYCNEQPVASLLLFGGSVNRSTYLGYDLILSDISLAFRQNAPLIGIDIIFPEQPDVITLAMGIAFTCMKHGYYHEGYITENICTEATKTATSYLSLWINQEIDQH